MTTLDIIGAWKDEEYRLCLSEVERAARDPGTSLNHNETLVRDQIA